MLTLMLMHHPQAARQWLSMTWGRSEGGCSRPGYNEDGVDDDDTDATDGNRYDRWVWALMLLVLHCDC